MPDHIFRAHILTLVLENLGAAVEVSCCGHFRNFSPLSVKDKVVSLVLSLCQTRLLVLLAALLDADNDGSAKADTANDCDCDGHDDREDHLVDLVLELIPENRRSWHGLLCQSLERLWLGNFRRHGVAAC